MDTAWSDIRSFNQTANDLFAPTVFLILVIATVAINGGANAGLLAAKILATSDAALLDKLKAYSVEMKETVQGKADKLAELGHKEYMKQM